MVPLTLAILAVAAFPDVSPDPATLKLTADDIRKAESLIPKLGSTEFAVREAADRDLKAMGRRALPVLAKTAKTALDPEIRVRSERLLARAAADDFNARLATFLADTEGKYEHSLPGWPQFREATGKATDARELFADIMRSEPNRDLIAGLALSKEELVRRVLARRQELYAKLYPTAIFVNGGQRVMPVSYAPSLVDAVTLLFADILTGDKDGARMVGVRAINTSTLLTRTGALRNDLWSAPETSALRQLFAKWVDTRESPLSLYQAMTTATQMDMKDIALKTAKKLLTIDVGVTPMYRGYAITTLGKMGGKAELPTVVNYLADDTVVMVGNANREELQLRDVALAMAMLLTDRPPNEFGYLNNGNEMTVATFSYFNCRFPDAVERERAFARWIELEPKLVPMKKK